MSPSRMSILQVRFVVLVASHDPRPMPDAERVARAFHLNTARACERLEYVVARRGEWHLLDAGRAVVAAFDAGLVDAANALPYVLGDGATASAARGVVRDCVAAIVARRP